MVDSCDDIETHIRVKLDRVCVKAECAPADSKPFNLAKDSSFIDLFPLSFNSVFKTSTSIKKGIPC